MEILDLFFPKRCVICKNWGSYICANCFTKLSFDTKAICLICDESSFNNMTHSKCLTKYTIDGCFSAIAYNSVAQKLIYNFKDKPYLKDLKNVLIDLFYESIIQNESFNNQLKNTSLGSAWIFVPIPLFSPKLRKRGYNQSEVLAKSLSKKFNLKTFGVLQRIKDTRTQFKLSKDKRKENIKGAFKLKQKYLIDIKNKNIFLVDDIVTTGETLKEASRELKRAGAGKVIGLTLTRD